jgi:carbonic anhydrase
VQAFAGTATVAPFSFYAFTDIAEYVRQQVQNFRSHPWVPRQVTTRGFIYDVETGRLSEVYVP